MTDKERLIKMRDYELGFIETYIGELSGKLQRAQDNLETVKKYFNNLKRTTDALDALSSEDDKGDYLWRVETEMKGTEETIKSTLCLGRTEMLGEVIFENNWFQKGDVCANERLKISLITGPILSKKIHNGKQTFYYGYIVVSDDLNQLPIEGEYYGKLLLS